MAPVAAISIAAVTAVNRLNMWASPGYAPTYRAALVRRHAAMRRCRLARGGCVKHRVCHRGTKSLPRAMVRRMRGRDRSSALLVAGLWVSLGFHALVGMGFVRYGDALKGVMPDRLKLEPRKPPELPPEDRPKEPPTVKLGIAKSDADTMTWLGYERPTEHRA